MKMRALTALKMPQVCFCLAFLCGVLVVSLFVEPFHPAPDNIVPAGFIAITLIFLVTQIIRKFLKFNMLVLIVLTAFILGIVRYVMALPPNIPSHINSLVASGNSINITGMVAKEPERFDGYSRYVIRTSKITHMGQDFAAYGNFMLRTQSYPEFFYGDVLRINGVLEAAPHESKLSYRTFLAKEGIYATMGNPRVSVVETGRGNAIWAFIIRIKEIFEDLVTRRYPEPYGSYLLGLLIGVRRGIPPDIVEAFRVTGLTHVLALSGFNITIVAGAIAFMLSGLSRRFRLIFCSVGIAFFVLFVGASTSVVRAGLMGILGFVAIGLGRPQDAWYPLLIAGTAMVLWNPVTLVFDIGFQLSFAATLGLVFLARPLQKRLEDVKLLAWAPNFLIETCAVTFAAQIATLPLIMFHFGQLSLISPISNLIVLPFVSITMLFGFLSVVFDFIYFGLGILPGIFAYACLWIMLNAIQLLAGVSWASVSL